MSRLHISTRDDAPAASKPFLDAIFRRLRRVPNAARLMAASPAVIRAFAAFQEGLSTTLDKKTRQRIALAVSAVNRCEYCLASHTYLAGQVAHLPPDEVARNKVGDSSDSKASAAVAFAAKVARARGRVTDRDLTIVKSAGYEDAQIVEIIALVAESTFENYLNLVAKTAIDFPQPPVARVKDATDAAWAEGRRP